MEEVRLQLDYAPTPRQRLFHASTADEVLYGGAAGGGKTKAVVMDALLRCLRHAGTQAYLFRRTYRELKDTVLGEALQSVPTDLGEYCASDYEFRLINGSVMRFRHCQYDEDRMRYQGAEIQWLYIDELTHFSKAVYDFLKSRLRARRALKVKPLVRATANPGGVGHAWVRDHFIERGEPEKEHVFEVYSKTLGRAQRRSIVYIPALCTDNPYLGQDYIFELEQKPRALRDALLHGRWDAFEGQVFSEWRDVPEHYHDGIGTHVIADFAVPHSWKRYRAFDFGFARPFAALWMAVDPDERVYVYREMYGAGAPDEGVRKTPVEIARAILQAEKDAGEGEISGVADPSIWDASRGESIAAQMAREGVHFQKGDNARIAGKMQMHKRLAFDGTGRPFLYVMRSCRHTIRTIPALVYDPMRPEDVNTAGEDHIYDALRYFLMSRPAGPERERMRARPGFDPLSGGKRARKGFWDA
ncbi:MAG: phage terminase large subunit [Bacillota bacterium]